MNLHPTDRPPDIETFRDALLGDWNPAKIPGQVLPAPKMEDLFAANIERGLAVAAVGLILISLIVTLTHF
jgi:hypothetical protein